MAMIEYIIYFGITISILVFVHEFGHFAAAKLCKMRTDAFSIGFGKRLFGWNKVIGFTWGALPKDYDGQGHTDYRLCLIPLGGYVKIAGMVDESFDTEFANKKPEPYEFRSKPTYQKLFVISAGVLMNLFLTFVIFWGINFLQGTPQYKTTTIGIVAEKSFADSLGFKSGDKILSVNNNKVKVWRDVLNQFLITNMGKDINVELLRNGKEVKFNIPAERLKQVKPENFFLNIEKTKVAITQVLPDSPAADAGVIPNDIFLKLNNRNLLLAEDAISIIKANPDKELPLTILRGTDTINTIVKPTLQGLIGVGIGYKYTGEINYKTYGFFESMRNSVVSIVNYTELTFVMVKRVVVGNIEVGQAFGGPIKIAKFATDSANAGLSSFLFFLAMLSLSLAIINIMPFPVLDGGHLVIILIEGIIRRELPIKIKIAIQNIGFVLLLMLMAVIIYYDFLSL